MIASTNHNRQTSGPLNAPDVHGLNFEAICEITNEKNVHTKPFVSVQRVDYTALSTNELVATVRRVCIQEGKPLVIENLHKADTWRPELFTLDWLAENAPDLRFEPRNTTDRTNGPEISLAEYIDYIRDPHHGWERIRQKTDEQDSTLEQDLSSIKQEQILDESSQGTTPTVSRTTENDVRHHHRNPISSQSSSMSPTPPDAKPSDTPPRSSSPMAPRPPTDHQDSKALVSGEPNEQCQPANREQRESVVDGSAYAREATDSSYTLTGGITGENSNTVITDQSVYPAEVDVDITMFDSERGMNDDEAETEEVMEAGEIAKDNTRYDFKNVIAAGQVLVKSEPFDCPIVKVESQNDEAPPPTLYGKDIDCPDAWRQYVAFATKQLAQ
ncbi:hypothetical protein BC937DRAFT_86348 [Endogone sp. FLAS-F59071]|nr:hypothetical protein BC937DRAFT_86348 [Endogone sp. FLAS-F59071]|eukprot:RUS13103.1 hypothetical protein BC937DRAFT_86348 [Endogone sp. FLAS-F59071]